MQELRKTVCTTKFCNTEGSGVGLEMGKNWKGQKKQLSFAAALVDKGGERGVPLFL